jgi:hypothetical protein
MSEDTRNIERLELNRETVRDLSDGEAEGAQGGLITNQTVAPTQCFCINTQGCPGGGPAQSVKCTLGDTCTCITWHCY